MGGRRPAGGPARCIWVRTKWAASFVVNPIPAHVIQATRWQQFPRGKSLYRLHKHQPNPNLIRILQLNQILPDSIRKPKAKLSQMTRDNQMVCYYSDSLCITFLSELFFFFFFDEGSISYYLSNIPYVFFYGEYLNFKIHILLILNKRSDYKYIQGIKTIRVYLYIKVNF